MKKSNKKIPKTHLPKFYPGGRADDIRPPVDNNMYGSPESEGSMMGATQDMGVGTQNIYNQNRAKSNMLGTNQKLTGNQYAQMGNAVTQGAIGVYQTSQTPGLSEYEKNQKYGNSIKATETGVVSAINPIFGMIHSGVTAATAPLTAKATQTDEQGNLKNKNFAKADIIGQGFADPMAMIPTMISNKFSMKKYINSVEDNAKGKIAAQKAQEDAYAQQQTDYQNQQQSMMDAAFARGFANQNQTGGNTYVQYAKYGGQMKYAMGGMNMQPNAEIESEENVVAPNGGFLQANGPTHENGGVPVALPGNSMVFSDRLKLGKKTFAELNKVNNTNKEDKILESNKFGNTSKRTAELMKFAKNKNSQELFGAQEALKQAKVEAYAKKMGVTLPQAQEAPEEGMQYPMGGKLPMYSDGGPVDNTKFTPSQRQQAYNDSMTLYNSGLGNQANFKVPGSNDALHSLHLLNKKFPTPVSTRNVNTPAGTEVVSQYQKPVYNPSMVKKVKPINYPIVNIPMKGLENPSLNFNPQLQQVPANSKPGSSKIEMAPNFSIKKRYDSQGNLVDKEYFDTMNPERQIEVAEFRNGGRMLPKYAFGYLTPEQQFAKTRFMGAEQNQKNLAFNQMTGNTNPGYSTYNSDYEKALQQTRDEVNAQQNKINPPQEEELQLANDVIDKQHGWNRNDLSTRPKSKSKSKTDPNDKNFDWGNLAMNVGNFAAQNVGNLYNLSRYNKPEIEKYDRMKATFLDPSASLRDATEQTRRAEYNVRGASGGNAGTYLANRVGLNAQNIMTKDRIQKEYQNANAGIANFTAQYNNELARQEVIANAMNRARNRSGKGEAISQIGKNYNQQVLDTKKGKMEESMMQMLPKLVNDPSFMKFYEEYKKNNPND